MMGHLDELTHWLYAVKGLAADQVASVVAHLSDCVDCAESQFETGRLDAGLRELALVAGLPVMREGAFEPSDPFRRRPRLAKPASERLRLSPAESMEAVRATERAALRSEGILKSIQAGSSPDDLLGRLSLHSAEDRFTLLYALQEGGRRSAANPLLLRTFAQTAVDRLRGHGSAPAGAELVEGLVPRLVLRGQAHLLLATTLLWLKEFSRARAHLIVAYRSFAGAGADEISFALVEFFESQRRSLSGDGRSALALARRARETFEGYGMDDYAARATVAEGLAHWALEEDEEAVRAYRAALPAFERHRLWSNYVGALNSAATSLNRLGRFEEARREYARALRRFSHEEHRSWLGYLRIGFAEALFAAERFSEAAEAAARAVEAFEQTGLRAHELIALLLEVESRARAGDLDFARERLDVFRGEVERDHALDPAVQRELVAALSGSNPDYENISSLRHRVGGLLEERYRA